MKRRTNYQKSAPGKIQNKQIVNELFKPAACRLLLAFQQAAGLKDLQKENISKARFMEKEPKTQQAGKG